MVFSDEFENDEYVRGYFKENRHLSPDSVTIYKYSLDQFSKANGETIKNMVDKCLEQQAYDIVGKKIKPFSPNSPTSLIKQYYNNFIDFCEGNGNSNDSINGKMKNIQTFLYSYGVDLPKWKPLQSQRKKPLFLNKEDIKFVLDNCDVYDTAVITFLASTGFRVKDCSLFTIGMFMEATKEFHDFVDVDDFIDNASPDMIGYWNLIPNKTKRNSIPCQTFSSPESTYYILQHLKRIKNEYIPKKNKKDGLSLKLTKDDALFGSREKYYKESLPPKGIGDKVKRKNKMFREWRLKQIDQKIANKEISEEDRDKEMNEIPTFRAHKLRSYFCSTIDSRAGLSSRACALMEGHRSDLPTDPSYIAKEKDELFEGYQRALPHLTFLADLETKILTNTQSEKLTKEVEDLKQEKQVLEEQLENLQQEKDSESAKVRQMEERLKEVEDKVETRLSHLDVPVGVGVITTSEEHFNRRIIIEEYFLYHRRNDIQDDWNKLQIKVHNLSLEEYRAISEIAYDIAIHENIDEVEKVVKKAVFKFEVDPSLRAKAISHIRQENLLKEKLTKLHEMLELKLNEIGLWDEDEILEFCDLIENKKVNWEKLLLEDITEEYILGLIEDLM